MENPSLPIVCLSRFWNPSQYKNRALFKQNFSPLQPKLASMQQALSFLLYISDLEKQLIHLRKKIALLTADPINIKCLLKYIHEKKIHFALMILVRIRGKSALKYFVDIIGQAIPEEKFSMNKEVPEVEKGKQVFEAETKGKGRKIFLRCPSSTRRVTFYHTRVFSKPMCLWNYCNIFLFCTLSYILYECGNLGINSKLFGKSG